MIYVAILISLLTLMLMAALGLFIWNHVQALSQQIDTISNHNESQVQDVTAFTEQLHTLESNNAWYGDSVEALTSQIDGVVQVQANQANEIKRLLRRASASLRFGVEPREPKLLLGPEPTYSTLIEGPKTPTPRTLPLSNHESTFRLVIERPETSTL